MTDNEFWIKFWKYAVIGLVVLIMTAVGSCQSTRYQIRAVIESGVGPTAARCAIKSGYDECLLIASAEAEAIRNE